MAETKSVGSIDYAGAYATTFGNLSSGTVYQDVCGFKPQGKSDMRETLNEKMQIGMKALTTTTGGIGTAGYAMVPVYLDPRVIDQTRKFTPLVEIIPRITNMGTTAEYNYISAKGGAYTRAEDAALAETNTTYDRDSTSIKYLYSVGRVTGQSIASYPSYILAGFQTTGGAVGSFTDQGAPNAKQLEVLVKTREMRELEENLIINGNATTSGVGTNPDGTEYDGIINLMSTTNTVDRDTAALTWDNVETAVRYAFDDGGRPTVAVASAGVVVDIRKLMQDTYRFSPQDMSGGSLGFGIPAAITIYTMVGPVTVIPSMYMSNVSGSKAIYFLDMSVVEMRVLQDMTYEDLAKTGDSDKFMLKCYEALLIKNTNFCSSITGISA